MEEYPRQEKQERGGGLVLMISSPFQGHLNPIFQLATLLHSRGFSITIIHPTFNSPNPSNHPPDFIFQPFSDGLSTDDVSTMDLCSLVSTLNLKCEAPFRDCLARILSEKTQEKVIRCIICDSLMHFSLKVAHELGVPRLAVITFSATGFVAFTYFQLLRERGYLPPQDRQSEEPIPELHPLRVKDLPWLDSAVPNGFFPLVENMVEATKASSGVIWNSTHGLESTALSKIQRDFQIPMFPIGPLHLYSSSTSSNSLLTEDQSCIAWLDKHPPRSVIYVSFGSLAGMGREELVEIAWGLANTNRPFLWVVRADSIHGSKRIELPQGFMEETCERGHVIGWAPQQQVLAHPAVGAFWTHNGWNSTLESTSTGVPMICSPCFVDQQVNARYVSHVWRVGVQLENGGVKDRKSIERAVRKLMAEREGEEIRERAKEVKEIVGSSIKEGGSSYHSLNHLVHHILSL